jgi:hypothetical protein
MLKEAKDAPQPRRRSLMARGSQDTGSAPAGDHAASEDVETQPLTIGRIVRFNIGVIEPDFRPAIALDEKTLFVYLKPGDLPVAWGTRLTIICDGAAAIKENPVEGEGLGEWSWPKREG